MKRAPLIGPELEEGRPLGKWVAAALAGDRLVRAVPLPGGYRNVNLLLTTSTGQQYVLRRYRHGNRCPVEAVLPATLPPGVPVADVVTADPDGADAGEPVLLSRFVDGTMLGTVLPGLDRADANRVGRSVGLVLASIGVVTFPEPGLFADATLQPVPLDEPEVESFVADCLARRHPGHWLSEADAEHVRRLAARAAAHLDRLPDTHHLVHADFNPKNLLVRCQPDGWAVAAVLDWEFAFSGSPLCDIGNMTRFASDYPPGYVDGFLAGFSDAGGHLPPDWRDISRALDLYALADFLTRPPHEVSRRVVALLRAARP